MPRNDGSGTPGPAGRPPGDLAAMPADMTPKQQACSYLREQILSGGFPAGMRLKTEHLARTLGLSRMPVRDALTRLHSEGLVEIRPNRGATVTLLGADEVQELFEIRAVLEGLAARHACVNLTEPVIAELESVMQRMARVTDDKELWLSLHERLHELLIEQSGRRRLIQQVRSARRVLTPYIRMYVAVYKEVEMQNSEHEVLLRIARHRNPDLIEAAVRDHVLTAAKGVVSFLQRRHYMADEGPLDP